MCVQSISLIYVFSSFALFSHGTGGDDVLSWCSAVVKSKHIK